MGFFGTYQFDGVDWSEGDPGGPSGAEPWLWVDVHDSDIATLRYAPIGPGTGVAYLGCTPRLYFDSDEASAPTDTDLEARGLAEWRASLHPDAADTEPDFTTAQVRSLLATDDPPADETPTDDADIFVEIKTARLLLALNLPLPDDLQDLEA